MKFKTEVAPKLRTNLMQLSALALTAIGVTTTGQAHAAEHKLVHIDPTSGKATIRVGASDFLVEQGEFIVSENGQTAVLSELAQTQIDQFLAHPHGLPPMMQQTAHFQQSASAPSPPSASTPPSPSYDIDISASGGLVKAKGLMAGQSIAKAKTAATSDGDALLGISAGVIAIGGLTWLAFSQDWFNQNKDDKKKDDDKTKNDKDDDSNEKNSDLSGTYNYVFTTGLDKKSGDANDNSFGARIDDFSSQDTLDGGAGNDTFTVEFAATQSTVNVRSLSNVSNVEKVVLDGLESIQTSSTHSQTFGLVDIKKGTDIEITDVDSLEGRDIDDVDSVIFAVHSQSDGQDYFLPQTDDLFIVRTLSNVTKQLDLNQNNEDIEYSNAQFALADDDSKINLKFDDDATGTIKIFNFDDNLWDLDFSDYKLKTSDFRTITSTPTSMSDRIEYDARNKILYIDNNGDGKFDIDDDMSVQFIGGDTSITTSDITF